VYPIIDVPSEDSQALEQMGSKPKFWFEDRELGLCLFKKIRQDTGEDWAEKVAAELAETLGIPHARSVLSG